MRDFHDCDVHALPSAANSDTASFEDALQE
jgi:hypothetical protein